MSSGSGEGSIQPPEARFDGRHHLNNPKAELIALLDPFLALCHEIQSKDNCEDIEKLYDKLVAAKSQIELVQGDETAWEIWKQVFVLERQIFVSLNLTFLHSPSKLWRCPADRH